MKGVCGRADKVPSSEIDRLKTRVLLVPRLTSQGVAARFLVSGWVLGRHCVMQLLPQRQNVVVLCPK